MPNEALLVNTAEGNGIADVCVYLQKAPEGYVAPPVPQDPVVMDIQQCRFVPHVLALRVNQRLLVKCADPIAHTMHALPIRSLNPYGGVVAPNDRAESPASYNKPDRIPVIVVCDLHPWMRRITWSRTTCSWQ